MSQVAKERGSYFLSRMTLNILLNVLVYAIFYTHFNYSTIIEKIFTVFIITLSISIATLLMAIGIVALKFESMQSISKMARVDGSRSRYFLVNLAYSFFSSLIFSTGLYWIVVDYIASNDIGVILLFYAIFFIISECLAYGIVTYLANCLSEYRDDHKARAANKER